MDMNVDNNTAALEEASQNSSMESIPDSPAAPQEGGGPSSFWDTPIGGIICIVVWGVIAQGLMFVGQLASTPLYFMMQAVGMGLSASGNELLGDSIVSGAIYACFVGVWIVTLIFLWVRKKDRFILSKIGYGGGNTFRGLLLGLLMGCGMNMFCNVLAMLHGDIHVYFNAFYLPGVLLLIVLVFIQSSAEELVFRGYYYRKVLQRFKNPEGAMILSAVLFGAIHISNEGSTFIGVLSCMLSGLLYAEIVCYFDSIWCTFAAHTAWNFTQNFIMGLPNSGVVVPYSIFKLDTASARDSFFYSTSFGPEGSMTSIIIHIVVIVALYCWYKNRKKAAAE